MLSAGVLSIVLSVVLVPILDAATDPRISQITTPAFVSSIWTTRAIDMDGDGDMDLLSAGNELVWIENLGNRTFSNPRMFRYNGHTVPIAWSYLGGIGDLDGDGRIDALQRTPSTVSGKHVMTASLSNQTMLEASRVDLGVTADIFNLVALLGDARMEILRMAAGDAGHQTLTIENLMEDGSIGILAGPYDCPDGADVSDAKAVDVDGDGDLDLHLGDWILERTGPQTFAPELHPTDYKGEWADLDGDGLQDVFTAYNNRLEWAKNSGNFTFVAQAPIPIKGTLLRVVDMPSSGAILTFSESITTGSSKEWHVKQMLATGAVLSDEKMESGEWPVDIVEDDVDENEPTANVPILVEDFDGDGHMDVFRSVAVHTKWPIPYWLDRSLLRPWPAIDWGNPTGYDAMLPIGDAPLCRNLSFALLDIDADRDMDLAVGPDVLGRFMMLTNDGHGHFSKERFLDELLPVGFEEIGVRIDSIKSGDVDADGDADLMVNLVRAPYMGSPQYLTFFAMNSGNETLSIPELPVGTFDFIVGGKPCDALYDWDGDGDLDAMVGGAWQENDGGVLSQSATPLLSGASADNVYGEPISLDSFRVGDLDGDGRPDIISEVFGVTLESYGPGGGSRIESSSMGIGFSDAFGVIEEVAEAPIQLCAQDWRGNPLIPGGTAIIDVNLDGNNDLVFTSYAGTDWLGNPLVSSFWKRNPGKGSRNVANWVTLPLPISLVGSKAGDFNGDGVADYSNGTAFLTPRPSGPLVSPNYDFTGWRFGFWYNHATEHVVDLDGDGDEDLIVSAFGELHNVRNLIIDERSGVAAQMRADGVLGQLANPDQDADGDGRSNALEFLQGTDPRVPDAANPERSQPSLVVNGSAMTIRYENRANAAELNLFYQLESSENLVEWTPVKQAGASHQPLSNSWRETTVTAENMPTRAFYRVHMRHEVPAAE